MEAPIVSSAVDSDERAMEAIWKLHQLLYRLEIRHQRQPSDQAEVDALRSEVEALVQEHLMPFHYEIAWNAMGWQPDAKIMENLKTQVDAKLADLQAKHEDAVKNGGEIELMDSLVRRGKFLYRIGGASNNTQALALFDELIAMPKVPANRKIDALLEKSKLFLFQKDMQHLSTSLDSLASIVEKSGDWDRKNKFKVLQGFQKIILRDIKKAATLFFDGVATFSSTDLCSYFEYMRYACITNLLTLGRKDLKKKILDNAHVIAYFVEDPFMEGLVSSLYDCEYLKFMHGLLELETILLDDRFMGQHAAYILRELRVIAFSQYLEAYKSVTLSSMSKVFGVSVEVLDRDLSNFISMNKLAAKIDFEGDFVETVQSERRTAAFQEVIAKGDQLLTQVQKLVRLLD